jgi:hypothetical protein
MLDASGKDETGGCVLCATVLQLGAARGWPWGVGGWFWPRGAVVGGFMLCLGFAAAVVAAGALSVCWGDLSAAAPLSRLVGVVLWAPVVEGPMAVGSKSCLAAGIKVGLEHILDRMLDGVIRGILHGASWRRVLQRALLESSCAPRPQNLSVGCVAACLSIECSSGSRPWWDALKRASFDGNSLVRLWVAVPATAGHSSGCGSDWALPSYLRSTNLVAA